MAGFNQFFDDLSATKSEVWGVALDQKFGKKAFGGVEYSQRDLTIPQTLFQLSEHGEASVSVEARGGHEDLARAYLFAAPHPWLTFGAEYQYEKFERDPGAGSSRSEVKTHRVPLSARFFHPSGFSAFVGRDVPQAGRRVPDLQRVRRERVRPRRTKDFWVVDAGLRYRLPKRYGFLVGRSQQSHRREVHVPGDGS